MALDEALEGQARPTKPGEAAGVCVSSFRALVGAGGRFADAGDVSLGNPRSGGSAALMSIGIAPPRVGFM